MKPNIGGMKISGGAVWMWSGERWFQVQATITQPPPSASTGLAVWRNEVYQPTIRMEPAPEQLEREEREAIASIKQTLNRRQESQ